MLSERAIQIGPYGLGGKHPLLLIAGPCVIESRDHTLRLAESIASVCHKVGIPLVFKASFDKANRSSIRSFRGPGLDDGLAILSTVKETLGLPVISDIHLPNHAAPSAEVLDCLQIPAFLCRQTDLLVAAAETQLPMNVKKGQFMSPEEMKNVVDKIASTGNPRVALTERGTFFGYNRLVNDMTGIERMQAFGPVVFDVTHSCQMPGAGGELSGGQRQFVPVLARAAVAAGCDGLFMEVHDDPDNAKSDPATVYPLDRLEAVLQKCRRLSDVLLGE